MHLGGIRRGDHQGKQALVHHLAGNFVGDQHDLRILRASSWSFPATRAPFELRGGGIELDQFQTGLDLNLLVIERGEGVLQVGLGISGIAGALLGDSQESLQAGKVGLHFEGSAEVRDRFGEVALKEQEHAEVRLAVEVLGVERDDFAQQRDGDLRLLLLKCFCTCCSRAAIRLAVSWAFCAISATQGNNTITVRQASRTRFLTCSK